MVEFKSIQLKKSAVLLNSIRKHAESHAGTIILLSFNTLPASSLRGHPLRKSKKSRAAVRAPNPQPQAYLLALHPRLTNHPKVLKLKTQYTQIPTALSSECCDGQRILCALSVLGDHEEARLRFSDIG